MPTRISYKASVERDLRRLEPKAVARVLRAVESTLGMPGHKDAALSGEFAGLYRLRIGDYRVVYAHTEDGYLVLRIAHRRDVYRKGRPAT